MYSPKIAEALIPRLYYLAQARREPMTRLVNAILAAALERMETEREAAAGRLEDRLQDPRKEEIL